MDINIEKFLGLNESLSQTELEVGEAVVCRNFRLTDSYKLKKFGGYRPLFQSLGEGEIYGHWHGTLNGYEMHLFNYDGDMYRYEEGGVPVNIGFIGKAKTSIIFFNKKVFILNGINFKQYTGIGNVTDIEAYIPIISTSSPPSGGGTILEGLNALHMSRRHQFNADGSATVYQLSEKALDSIDKVVVNGAVVSNYSSDLPNGRVTFNTAPSTGVNNIEITYTKTHDEHLKLAKCKAATLFGSENNNRMFLFGNPDTKNRMYYSTFGINAPNLMYFPVLNYFDVGSGEYPVTGVQSRASMQVIFTEEETYVTTIDSYTNQLGDPVTFFRLSILDSAKGNMAFNQPQIVNNSIITLSSDGLYAWSGTNVRSELNKEHISKRIRWSLEDFNFRKTLMYDHEENGELWIHYGSECIIWNYRINAFYKRTNVNATCFLEVNGKLHFGTSQGTIMVFDNVATTDNGDLITSEYHTGYLGFGRDYRLKYITRLFASLKPEASAYVRIEFDDEKGYTGAFAEFGQELFTYKDVNYGDWSYETDINIRPFRAKIKLKKKSVIKIRIISDRESSCLLIGMGLITRFGGEIK